MHKYKPKQAPTTTLRKLYQEKENTQIRAPKILNNTTVQKLCQEKMHKFEAKKAPNTTIQKT